MDLVISKNFFERNASLKKNGEVFMSLEDFTNTLRSKDSLRDKIGSQQFKILFYIANHGRGNKLTYSDWVEFHNLLSLPDAEYRIVFKLFDPNDTGHVIFSDFDRILQANKSRGDSNFDVNWNDKWANLYMGNSQVRHSMTYNQFCQMLRGYLGERTRQAFLKLDKDNDGFITLEDFTKMIQRTHSHILSDYILENFANLLPAKKFTTVSYASVRAFENIIRELDLIQQIVLSATEKKADRKIDRQDFMEEAARITKFCHFTPLEVEILFNLVGNGKSDSKVGIENFARILDPSWGKAAYNRDQSKSFGSTYFTQAFNSFVESFYHFGLGAIAGGLGATSVYPIDLVKTRMQNQRQMVVGEVMYRNSWDCVTKVIRNEGLLGLYSGLGPQLIGVAPEKAIKLTVNDYIRKKLRREDGYLPFYAEVLAGAAAGACQVTVTNPLEVVKIQLQVRGQVANHMISNGERIGKVSALSIVKGVGLVGLYRGASACLMRDIPFSAMYFPTYSHLKSDLFGETQTKKCTILQLLSAGAIAGMPAAYLTTPADVIKTRLQVKAQLGQTHYKNIRHAIKTILKEEGVSAFFKGGLARVLRSSPQFGVTLASYEMLQKYIPLSKDSIVQVRQYLSDKDTDISYLKSRNAVKILLVISNSSLLTVTGS